MDESFHFRLLRVSISQIIKASGFDKCKPSVINALTDIYIHSFRRLILTARRCSETRTRSSSLLQVQDVMQALILTGEIKPENYYKLDDDPMYENTQSHPVSAYNTKSLDSFIDWMGYSDIYRVSQQLNELPQSLIKNLIEKRKLDLDDSSTDHERRKRKYQEKQNYYNSMLHRAGSVEGPTAGQDEQGEDEADEITHRDKLRWLNYLIEKDMKLGQDLKFTNTSLIKEFLMFQENKKFHPHMNSDEADDHEDPQDFRRRIEHLNDHDYVILPIEEAAAPEEAAENGLSAKSSDKVVAPTPTPHPTSQLMDLLPYNLQYPESLTRDDLEDFIAYREKREEQNEAGKLTAAPEASAHEGVSDSKSNVDETKAAQDPAASDNHTTAASNQVEHTKANEDAVADSENAQTQGLKSESESPDVAKMDQENSEVLNADNPPNSAQEQDESDLQASNTGNSQDPAKDIAHGTDEVSNLKEGDAEPPVSHSHPNDKTAGDSVHDADGEEVKLQGKQDGGDAQGDNESGKAQTDNE